MTRLTAVNAVLRRLGMTPVSVLGSTTGNSPEAQAERFLDDADESCQSQGWHFNRKIDVELVPDANSKIAVPTETFYRLDTYGDSASVDIRVKSGFLYNIADNTDIFTGNVTVSYIERVLWADLPETFASYMVSEAAFALNRAHKNIGSLDALLMEEMQKRKTECKREDNEHSDTNVLSTDEMNRLRGRQKTYWSNH